MRDHELLAAFEDCSLPPDEFTHRNHVRVAWICLRNEPLLSALTRFADGLKRYATSLGAATKYHETITWAFVFLIHERMRDDESFDAFATRNAELFEWKPLLSRYYREETLGSDRARAAFVMPDVGVRRQ